jgi:2-haloacid dehalogenase
VLLYGSHVRLARGGPDAGDDMRVLVFDVIETLLDLQAMDPVFDELFGEAGMRQQWFQQMLQSALVATVTGVYHDFGQIGRAALEMTARRRRIQLSEADEQRVLGTIRRLPPHPDVIPGLSRLREAGFRMAALTNSTPAVAEEQLRHAGLREFFEQVLSADMVRRFKPAGEVYREAARRLGVEPAEIRLVAAHAWDVTGAIRAGCAAAFVARPNMVLDPAGEQPDLVGGDLRELAEAIVAAEHT